MTDRLDVHIDRIDWESFFTELAAARGGGDAIGSIYRSGVLNVFDWMAWICGDGQDLWTLDEHSIGLASIDDLRRLLTALTRQDRFTEGTIEESLWDGTLDLVLAAIGDRVGTPYPLEQHGWLPARIRPCPECGDVERVQMVFYGLPAGMPPKEEQHRIKFAGCVIDDVRGPVPNWYCPRSELWYTWLGDVCIQPIS